MELKNIKLPGDKSLSHRALIFAALRTGITELENLSSGEDVKSTRKCLSALGVEIQDHGPKVVIRGVGLRGFKKPMEPLDCGNSGTTMRLFMGLLAAQKFETTLIGDESLSSRPMKRVADPLVQMGARIELANADRAPVRIFPAELQPLTYDLPVASSQVKSALMIAGLVSGQEISLGGAVNSRDHTERMLPYFMNQSGHIAWKVPGDISSASFWIAAGLLAKVKVELEDVLLNPTRLGFLNLLKDCGVAVELNVFSETPEPRGNVVVEPSVLNPYKISRNQVPYLVDEIPVLVLLASQSHGTSIISGAEELRFKETDRIAKTAEVLLQLGVSVETTSDGFIIHGPQKLIGGPVDTFHDHRLTMMAAVAGLACENKVTFKETESAKISDPFFFEKWNSL